jgi:hypothetical protein
MGTASGTTDPFAWQPSALNGATTMTLDLWRLWLDAAQRGSNGGARAAAAARIDMPTDRGNENLGAVVWSRVLRSSRVYMRFADFWIEFLRDLPGLQHHRSPGTVFGRWAKLYGGLFEQVVGSPSHREPAPAHPWVSLLEPWLNAAKAWSAVWPRRSMAPGTAGGGGSGTAGLWGDVLNETLGKLMPGSRQRSGGSDAQRTREATLRFQRALPPLYELFYSAGVEALREFLTQVGEDGIEAVAARPLREVYRMWWTANENAFVRLFALPDFGNAMNEVVSRSLDLKTLTEDIAAGGCQQASLPTRSDFDELAAALHDLRRTVRRQQDEIESLHAELAAGRRRGRTA